METTIVEKRICWGYIGIKENKVKTSRIGYILGTYWDNGKYNGHFRGYRGDGHCKSAMPASLP